MSLTLSLDVLRMTVDPSTGKPYFNDKDIENSQIVFLDDLADGPYFDLWTMLAKKPPVRHSDASFLNPTKIVVPLPGSSNPFWQGGWADLHCGESVLLKTLSRRVIDFYSIAEAPPRSERPLTLTLIDRRHKRRLLN